MTRSESTAALRWGGWGEVKVLASRNPTEAEEQLGGREMIPDEGTTVGKSGVGGRRDKEEKAERGTGPPVTLTCRGHDRSRDLENVWL
jgi:hypothetical protein